MKRISQKTVDRIYAETDIVAVIGEFVQLKKRGHNYFGLSPFVNEKTPSFTVHQGKGIWKDFSTGKGGNAVSFLMESEGMNYPEALKHLADKAAIQIEYDDDTQANEPDTTGTLKAISSTAASLFQSQLVAGSPALIYLHSRGVTDESIQAFQIGYAPDQWEWLAGKLSNFGKEAVKQSGLCFEQDSNQKLTDRFSNRIMFPITDHFGKVIAFGGRVFNDGKGAKYINSPASPIYDKSRVLYGLSQARRAIVDRDQCLLTEGYLDVIQLHQCGQVNTVASCGTALTVHQCQLIRRFTLNVLLVRDSDKAGLAAMVKDVQMILSQGMYPSVLPLPKGDDPDSFCRKVGKEGFEAHKAKHTRNFVDFLIAMAKRSHDANEPQGRAAIIHEVMEVFKAIQDPVLLHTSQQRLAQIMAVPIHVVANGQHSPSKSNGNTPTNDNQRSSLAGMHPHEVGALRMVTNHGEEVGKELIEALAQIPPTSYSELFVPIMESLTTLQAYDLNSLMDKSALRGPVGECLQIASEIQDFGDAANAVIRDFERHHLQVLIEQCRQRMKDTTDQTTKTVYMNKIVTLTTTLRKL